MISVTHLNNTPFFLNPHLIETVEATPDTILTLTGGKKLLVRETTGQIVERITDYRKEITSGWRGNE